MSTYGPPFGSQPGDPGQQPPYGPYGSPPPGPYGAPPPYGYPQPRKNKTPLIIGIVAGAALLLCCGGGTAAFLLIRDVSNRPSPTPTRITAAPSPSSRLFPSATPRTSSSRDTTAILRYIKPGQCVTNSGTNSDPVISIVPCAPGTYEVLKNIPGTADGSACQDVPGYTTNYTNENSGDGTLSFTLCMKRR